MISSNSRRDLQILGRHPDMFHVKPQPMEPATDPDNVHQIVMPDASNATNHHKLVGGQTLLNRPHEGLLSGIRWVSVEEGQAP